MTPRHRVLAVEDDADTLTLMRLVLRDLPVDFRYAITGAEAIACLEREMPELIFLDINLPDMRGWQILDHFKADTRMAGAQIYILTGHSEPVHRLIGLLQPISAYLCKPITADKLRQTVRAALHLP